MFYILLHINSVDGVVILSIPRALSIAGNIKIQVIYWQIA
jgi:hypothetical protein